jgi:hypothetical protein
MFLIIENIDRERSLKESLFEIFCRFYEPKFLKPNKDMGFMLIVTPMCYTFIIQVSSN